MSDRTQQIVIVASRRTPIGSFKGSLAPYTCSQLAAHAIRAALESAAIAPQCVDECVMGTVCQAGCEQNVARCAALTAGLVHALLRQ